MEELVKDKVEYKDARVLTTQQLAEIYETEIKNIQMNFKNNKSRFIKDRDYYELKGNELKEFKNLPNVIGLVDKRTPSLILWTERGANRHSKILDTDKAWQQFDVLEETYFRVKKEKSENNYKLPMTYKEALIELLNKVEENEKLQLENKSLTNEVIYKENTIIGLIKDITVTDKRRRITEIIRHGSTNYSERYNKLYREFEMKYHIDLSRRMKSEMVINMKPKIKNKMDYVDRCLNMIPELYEVCCKIYENDVDELVQEMYSANNK